MRKYQKPFFEKDAANSFFHQLKAEVNENIITKIEGNALEKFKLFLFLGCYFLFYVLILIFGNNTFLLFLFYVFMGWSMILFFVNSFHDAVHNAIFKTKKYNHYVTWMLELFGSNSYVWIRRHNLLHHPYPNVQDWDIDIKQSDMVRLFPNSPLFKFHKYQHIYMWFLYPFYTLNWLFIRDFKDFFGTKDNYLKRIHTIPTIEYVKLIFFKLFSFFYTVILVWWVLRQTFITVFIAWIVMHVLASALGVIALISTHVDETAVFPAADATGLIHDTWAHHQMNTTKDFGTNSKVAEFLFGGFTHHVAHHLFPNVPHTYCKRITPVIRKYAEKYNLPYTNYPVIEAIRSHYRLLKNNGFGESIFKHGEL